MTCIMINICMRHTSITCNSDEYMRETHRCDMYNDEYMHETCRYDKFKDKYMHKTYRHYM